MNINEIITKHADEIYSMPRNKSVIISQEKTSEDVVQDVLLTAIKKFGRKNITEEEGWKYIYDHICLELFFQKKRKGDLVYMETLPDISDEE